MPSPPEPAGDEQKSLAEVHGTVPVPTTGGFLKSLLAFAGPGYLVAVGYMDPGNWATALAAGSAFGYALLSAALLSSLMAILLQSLAARLGIVAGRDLAQLCRDRFPRPVAFALWLLAEVAVCATDLAELIGTAIALRLLFGIPLLAGVVLTALDALLILWLHRLGVRWLEALVAGLIALIAGCFAVELALSRPTLGALMLGYLPTPAIVAEPMQLYLAIGILGATVMPHNLYLHTAIVQSRAYAADLVGKREAIRFATIDSTLALSLALVVNSAILVVAASVFHVAGRIDVAEIQDAYHLLAPLLGVGIASTLFGVALLASGIASTVTATLAGQIVMEGFLRLRIPAWLRRLITRLIAMAPAILVTWQLGERGTAQLLILSQVILSLQLPFAVIPLLLFVGDRARMGPLRAPRWQLVLGWASAALVVAANLKLLLDLVRGAG
jgi:manganese transport protein